ncbi:uncharacterized protein METZ01_LOCUS273424 [marine metagenome]|uniref:Uncharacterized protein n=1 Tax=marine metagenome TaxID=408172 RepID=A0A382K7Y1_9ZZZZ
MINRIEVLTEIDKSIIKRFDNIVNQLITGSMTLNKERK